MMDLFEIIWEDILSQEPDRVRAAFRSLDAGEQRAVRRHLQKMVSEEGWLEVQQISARAALEAIQTISRPRHRKR